jgi:hypothetical protein
LTKDIEGAARAAGGIGQRCKGGSVKIKDKHTGRQYELKEESENFYIVNDGSGLAIPKGYAEKVKEERWVDVTRCCEFDVANERVVHEQPKGARLVVIGNGNTCMWNGYRLRKVQGWVSEKGDPFFREAFIIEKKESL